MSDTGITPLTPTEEAAQEASAAHESYVTRGLIAFDDLVNVLTDGAPDETVSSRMARWATNESGLKRDIGAAVSKALDLLQADHGAKAEAGDLERAQAAAAIEETSGNLPPG